MSGLASSVSPNKLNSCFVERTYLISAPSILDAPEDDAAFRGSSHHLVFVSVWAAYDLGVKCDAFNGPVKVGGGKHLLPTRRFLYPVMRSKKDLSPSISRTTVFHNLNTKFNVGSGSLHLSLTWVRCEKSSELSREHEDRKTGFSICLVCGIMLPGLYPDEKICFSLNISASIINTCGT